MATAGETTYSRNMATDPRKTLRMYILCKDRLDALGGAHLRAALNSNIKLRIPRTMMATAAEILASEGAGVTFTQPVRLRRIMLLTMVCIRHRLDLRSVTTKDMMRALHPTVPGEVVDVQFGDLGRTKAGMLFRAFKDIGRVGPGTGAEADYGCVMTQEAAPIPVGWYNPLHTHEFLERIAFGR